MQNEEITCVSFAGFFLLKGVVFAARLSVPQSNRAAVV
jgi:hypothetical protein